VALFDLSAVMGAQPYRVIGGHMVTMLVARWGLGSELYRETSDADLGVPPLVVQSPELVDQLMARGYERRSGNRFGRPMHDVPVSIFGALATIPEATIDILVPAYTGRPRNDKKFGTHLVTTEVPGLATALRRPPVVMSLRLRRMNGEVLDLAQIRLRSEIMVKRVLRSCPG
jgi:hypothetical protein